MNYSQKGTQRKAKDLKSTKKRLVSKTGVSIFRILIVSLVALVIIGGFAGYGFIKGVIDSAPDINDISINPTGFSTTVYDSDNNEIEKLVGAEANREYVTIDQIPEIVQNAFIAIEDERFYEHNGIDVRGIFRAFFKGLASGGISQGASTITQQLLKNQVFNGGREGLFADKVKRKIQEQYLAVKLESQGPKMEVKKAILERYLNTINCGAGTYGVQTAAKRYFGKDISELTLSEATVLAVITNSPVNYNPITNPEANAKRRQLCLDKMLELEYITQEEYDDALADDVYERIQTVNDEYDTTRYYSYFVDGLIDEVIDDLVNIGYSQSEATNLVYSGGLSIYSTQDSTIQGIVDDVYSDESYFPAIGRDSYYELTYALSVEYPDGSTMHYHTKDVVDYFANNHNFDVLFTNTDTMDAYLDEFKASVFDEATDKLLGEKRTYTIQPQSSFIVMDQHTGYVSAIVGGRGDKGGNRTLNRATSTVRQPGSTFKILSTYVPALDTAGLTLASTFDDSEYNYPGTNTKVSNWRTNTYKGLTTIREAIYDSMNIVAVKVLEQVTPQVAYDYLLKLGFTTLVDNRTNEDGTVYSDINYPLALGGITDGVTNLELTAGYAAIANGGTYTKPTFYTKIVDHDGNVIIDKTKPDSEQVMKESTAWLLTSAMQDVVSSKGTGSLAAFRSTNMAVAGKTGTTSSYLDTWFVGYTPYYTAGIWSGYDNNNLSQTNTSYHKVVWREIMERICKAKNLESKTFTRPDSIVTAKICAKSGKLAVDGVCDEAQGGSTVKSEYFAKGTVPVDKCDVHTKVKIDKTTNLLATEFCPIEDVIEKVFLIKDETSKTSDTPYLLPSKECTVHTKDSFLPFDDSLDEDVPPNDTDLDLPIDVFPPSNSEDTDSDSDDTNNDSNSDNSDGDVNSPNSGNTTTEDTGNGIITNYQ